MELLAFAMIQSNDALHPRPLSPFRNGVAFMRWKIAPHCSRLRSRRRIRTFAILSALSSLAWGMADPAVAEFQSWKSSLG